MKKQIRRYIILHILFVSFIILPNISLGQTAGTFSVNYSYDQTGNRKNRTIVIIKKSSSAEADSSSNRDNPKTEVENEAQAEQIYKDELGQLQILIYPNPTSGQLKVEITGQHTEQPITFQMYGLSGSIIYNNKTSDNPVIIDISDRPNGAYVLLISTGTQSTTWKIIKQ